MKKGIKFVAAILAISVSLGVCSCSRKPSDRTIESMAEERIAEDSRLVSQKEMKDGTIHYVMESRERDLTYEIVASPVTTGFRGYSEDICYAEAVCDYYRDDILKAAKTCPCYMVNPDAGLGDDILFYIDNDEDARAVASVLAKCNEIVADQYDYTPDADLTDPMIMHFRVRVIPGAERDRVFNHYDYVSYIYILNGLDGEEEVYNKIRSNVNPDT